MKVPFPVLVVFCLILQVQSFLEVFDKKSIAKKSLKPPTSSLLNTVLESLRSDENDFYRNDNTNPNALYVPIMELDYYGSWKSGIQDPTKQFDYFTGNNGSARFTAFDVDNEKIDNHLFFEFYDGKYVDQKATVFYYKYNHSTDFDSKNSTFKNPNINFKLYFVDELKLKKDQNCSASYQLSFIDTNDGKPFNKSKSHYMNAAAYFRLISEECKIDVEAYVAASDPVRESKALYYSLVVTLMCLGHLYATIQIIKAISQNEYDGSRYSLITLCLFTIWDIFLCLFHLYNALTSESFFHYFITPAFWFFILSSIFETRMILIVWKTRYYNSFANINEVRRGITIFYLKFYGGMIALLYLGYMFLPANWFLSLTAGFFIPQIVHNAIRGQRYKFDSIYVFLLGALRIAIPVYIRGCPEGIFELTPSYGFLEFYVAFVFFQIGFLYLQAKLGSRFFIPKCFLPPKYNYYVKISRDVDIEGAEEPEACSICMENLNEKVVSSNTALLSSKSKDVTIMVTPCRHKFHPECLQQWMDIKLECPFCRAPVPPLD